MIQSKRANVRCKKCGKLKRPARTCDVCYNRSPTGRARNRRYEASLKGRTRSSRGYYERLAWSGDSYVAKREAAPDDRERIRTRNKLAAKRFRERWGRLSTNPVHRHRWEMIREGLWKEDEHPL